jgi:hypothetical protein
VIVECQGATETRLTDSDAKHRRRVVRARGV